MYLNVKPGNAVVRQYRNAKVTRNIFGAAATLTGIGAVGRIVEKDTGRAAGFGCLSLYSAVMTKHFSNICKNLSKPYNEIVQRAAKIYK